MLQLTGTVLLALLDCARMFEVDCRFRDTKELSLSEELLAALGGPVPVITGAEIGALHPRTIAFDNCAGASDVYGLRPGMGFTLLVGNERRGLSHEVRSLAMHAAQVPMRSRRINCLNVAAAAAVALYYLRQPQALRRTLRRDPERRRPELLLVGVGDHVELGSALRSAAALGWSHVHVEDRHRVWFGVNRATRAEGRGAARRGRNDIRLMPATIGTVRSFDEVTVITTRPMGVPLRKLDLARGPRQVIIIPDESRIDLEREDWTDAVRKHARQGASRHGPIGDVMKQRTTLTKLVAGSPTPAGRISTVWRGGKEDPDTKEVLDSATLSRVSGIGARDVIFELNVESYRRRAQPPLRRPRQPE